MDHVGPFTYNALRFALGALTLAPVILIRGAYGSRLQPLPGNRARPWGAIPAGVLTGIVLCFGASFQQAGIVWTTAGKAGFITGLYVVLVPLAGLLWGQRTGASAWAGAFLCAAGLFLLSLTDALTIERGDLLVLVSAFLWAAHVQVVGWLSPHVDPFRLSFVQFAVCSLLCACGALLAEKLDLDGMRAAAWPILYGGVVSAGIAFTLQVVAQRKAPPAHAAILLSLESVFAAIGGSMVLGERLGARGVAGCAIMFTGMVVSQVPLIMSSFRHGGQSASSL
jgi:drug/metabolite transporter (DMT)-like permease